MEAARPQVVSFLMVRTLKPGTRRTGPMELEQRGVVAERDSRDRLPGVTRTVAGGATRGGGRKGAHPAWVALKPSWSPIGQNVRLNWLPAVRPDVW